MEFCHIEPQVFSQLLVNALYSGSQFALVAVGLALIYNVAGFLNFAHGAVYVVAAYATYSFRLVGISLFGAALFGILMAALIGGVTDWSTYRRLRSQDASPLVFLLASLGLFIVIQSSVAMIFGDSVVMLRSIAVSEGNEVFGARITNVQVIGISGSLILCSLVYFWLKHTLLGMQTRAVADDYELAKSVGLNTDRIILLVMAIASILAGFSGIIVAYDVDLRPTMGFYPLLIGVVAMVIGGVDRPLGSIGAAFFISISQEFAVMLFPSQWKEVIVFIILILFLSLKPGGFLGKDPIKIDQ